MHMDKPRAPFDICFIIIGYCAASQLNDYDLNDILASYRVLTACGLTCRAWLEPSRARLYSTVVFRLSEHVNRFCLTLSTNPDLAKHVKTLLVNSDPRSPKGIHLHELKLAKTFGDRKTPPRLVLHGDWSYYYSDRCKSLKGIHWVQKLHVSGRFRNLSHLLRLVWAFPTLVHLWIDPQLSIGSKASPEDLENLASLSERNANCGRINIRTLELGAGSHSMLYLAPALTFGTSVSKITLYLTDSGHPIDNTRFHEYIKSSKSLEVLELVVPWEWKARHQLWASTSSQVSKIVSNTHADSRLGRVLLRFCFLECPASVTYEDLRMRHTIFHAVLCTDFLTKASAAMNNLERVQVGISSLHPPPSSAWWKESAHEHFPRRIENVVSAHDASDEHPVYYPNLEPPCKSALSLTESKTRTSPLCIVCAESSSTHNFSLSLEEKANNYLGSEPSGKATYKDITHLGKNIRSINELFGKVRRALQTCDSESPDPKGALEPQWAALRKEFSQYIGNSRECAMSAAGITGVYADAILGRAEEINYNVRTFLNGIRTLWRDVEQRREYAVNVNNNFRDLSLKIKDFKNIVKVSMMSKDTGGSFLECLRASEKTITTIPTEEILESCMESLESTSTFAPNLSKALGILSPTVTLEAFYDTIGGNEAKMKLVREFVLDDIRNVSESIQVISQIWKNVRADMTMFQVQLHDHMSRVNVPEHASLTDYPHFMSNVNTSSAVCDALRRALIISVRTSERPDGFEQDGFEQDGFERDGFAQDGFERDGFARDVFELRIALRLRCDSGV